VSDALDHSSLEAGPAPSPIPRVLVAYASKYGGNAEIAVVIGEVLAEAGLGADVIAAPDVASLDGYTAVMLGSGLYSATWLRDANRFIRAHRAALRTLPFWLWSSGPLDRSADFAELPMPHHVSEVLRDLPIREHRTFGGRLLPDSPEVLAGVVARQRIGDFRDFARIRAWARSVAESLGSVPGPG
jgi:menaquinone-dependent protoporphyrinogen oxidase